MNNRILASRSSPPFIARFSVLAYISYHARFSVSTV
nr:MAG TPA: hypothetical protein [Caudoviricetes sp.]